MNNSRRVPNLAKRRSILALGISVLFMVTPHSFSQAASEQLQTSLLNQPPQLNYAKLCLKTTVHRPLARDWADWDGRDHTIPPDQILSDAKRLADGDNEVARDRVLARKMLSTIASGTSFYSTEAKTRLATLLLDPNAGPVDSITAARLLTEATAAQNRTAALTMGRLLRENKLPNATIADATRYLTIAAGLGDPSAALHLAAIASADQSLASSAARAHYITLATLNVQTSLASGDCSIAVAVGDYLIETDGIQGPVLANAWYEIAAKAGDEVAMARLARSFETGRGSKKDLKAAIQYWDQAAAAGYASAFALAARTRLSIGEDFAEIGGLLDQAMAHNDPEGYLIAARYYRGDYTGKADLPRMHKVLNEAKILPNNSAFTLEMLADAYQTGLGVPVDTKRAEAIYKNVLGIGTADAEALYGRYLIKHGVKISAGLKHLEHSAKGQSVVGMYHLADAAFCVGRDDAEQLMIQAANAGSPTAYRRLGRLALDHNDKAAAIKDWLQASQLDDRPSMVELAQLISAKTLVDDRSATELITSAAKYGSGVIDGRLALINAYMTKKLSDDGGKASELLASIADSQKAEVAVVFAKMSLQTLDQVTMSVALERLNAAAKAGNGEAMYLLAHLPGTVPMLPAEAKEWLIRAAETGQAKALAELSTEDAEVRSRVLTSLKQRLVCDVDSLIQVAKIARIDQMSEFADATLQKASAIARGQPRYMHLLAEATALQEPGYPGDAAKAVALYEEAIAKGYGKSALSLAKLYATGRLGEKTEAVIALYQNAALLGEATATRALANYSSDPSNPGRASLATNALQQLAKAGNADAMQALGTILTTSDSTRFDEGLSFLKAAADNGRIDAMKTLARLFAVGVNGKISAEESTRWIKQAAEQGDAEAMLQYAVALDIGFGVAVNQALSQSWHKKAAQNGLNP